MTLSSAPQLPRQPLPPHLTMDEYAAWIQASLQQLDPVKAVRQKAMQEQISAPFQLKDAGEAPPSKPPSPQNRTRQ
ncbi:MAG: hypothetical protein WC789_00240 [Lentisphaeria bacterium]|jgi:hypothetical protein